MTDITDPEVGLDTTGVVLNQETVTDSRAHLPRPIKIAEQFASQSYTTTFNVTDETVLKYLNRDLPDNQSVTGSIETVIDEKLVIDIDTHESSIGDEYGHQKLTLGHEFWVKIFGGEAVETVYRDTDQFGKPITKVEMFHVKDLRRDLFNQIDTQDKRHQIDIYTQHDSITAIFSHLMTDPYCLAMLHAEQYKREHEEDNVDSTTSSSTPTTAGVKRDKDRSTKYET